MQYVVRFYQNSVLLLQFPDSSSQFHPGGELCESKTSQKCEPDRQSPDPIRRRLQMERDRELYRYALCREGKPVRGVPMGLLQPASCRAILYDSHGQCSGLQRQSHHSHSPSEKDA